MEPTLAPMVDVVAVDVIVAVVVTVLPEKTVARVWMLEHAGHAIDEGSSLNRAKIAAGSAVVLVLVMVVVELEAWACRGWIAMGVTLSLFLGKRPLVVTMVVTTVTVLVEAVVLPLCQRCPMERLLHFFVRTLSLSRLRVRSLSQLKSRKQEWW